MITDRYIKTAEYEKMKLILSALMPKGPKGRILRNIVFTINPMSRTIQHWQALIKLMIEQMPEKTTELEAILVNVK